MVTDGDGVGERTPTDMSVNNWFYRESTRSRHQKCHQDRNLNTVEEHRSVNLGQRAPRAPRGGAEGGGGEVKG